MPVRYFLQLRPTVQPLSSERECEFEVRLPAVGGAPDVIGFVVFLANTRSQIAGMRTAALGTQGPAIQPLPQPIALVSPAPGRAPQRWLVLFPAPVSLTSASLAIRFDGDPVHVRATTLVRLLPGAPAPIAGVPAFDPSVPLPVPPPSIALSQLADLAAFELTWEQEIARREAVIDPTDSARQFFLDLDRLTHPSASSDTDPYAAFGASLALRFIRRGQAVAESDEGSLLIDKEEAAFLQQPLTQTERLFRYLFTKHFSRHGKIHYPSIRRAFDSFAGGALFVRDDKTRAPEDDALLTHSVPNGINMFAFAELAAMGRELATTQSSHRFWAQLFRRWSRSCEVFVRSYHREGSTGRRSCDYRPAFNLLGRRMPSDAARQAIADGWRGTNRVKRFNRLVYGALTDEFDGVGAEVAPMELIDF